MARRDISRHRGRSLLIILLILLPVAGMTGAAALAQSMQETPAERVQYQLGSTQARFRSMPASNAETVQDPVLETATMTRNFTVDPDSSGSKLVFNRTATLKDTWARVVSR